MPKRMLSRRKARSYKQRTETFDRWDAKQNDTTAAHEKWKAEVTRELNRRNKRN